jgi:hypothetical protein
VGEAIALGSDLIVGLNNPLTARLRSGLKNWVKMSELIRMIGAKKKMIPSLQLRCRYIFANAENGIWIVGCVLWLRVWAL